MALFDFIKDAGQALFHGHAAPSGTPAALPASQTNSAQSLAEKLESYLKSLNLGIENPQIKINGDTATLQGQAQNHEALEKAILAIGNTQGIAKVDSQVEVPHPAPDAPRFVTVKSGDTLSKIAKETLGDANKYPLIFEANKPMLKSPDQIFPGQTLRIPAVDSKAA